MTALTPQSAAAYLIHRGVLSPDDRAEVEVLGGGVSCTVLGIISEGGVRCVVKQARRQLRVAETWLASPERAGTEADALQAVARIVPSSVPRVLDVDRDAHILTIDYAPPDWQTWKDRLLVGDIDPAVAVWLGVTLAAIHSHTFADREIQNTFDRPEAFDQLRIGPYYRRTAERRPELAAAIGSRIGRLARNRSCLVHGDFSPKNVLVGTEGRWVVDFEVAHFGSPIFDVAFMVNHLLLKAVFQPELAMEYGRCADVFLDAYGQAVAPSLMEPIDEILAEVGCLMLARVDGKSPAEYLSDAQRKIARRLGRWLLIEPPRALDPVLGAFAAGDRP